MLSIKENQDPNDNHKTEEKLDREQNIFVLPETNQFESKDFPKEDFETQHQNPEINFVYSEPKVEKTSVQDVPNIKPVSNAELIRNTGLAWSAGIVFFGSVVFMMILGWFADLILGSSPWGLVLGIILGGIIGFMQFFRITSRIINSSSNLENTPLHLVDEQPKPDEKVVTNDRNSTQF